MYVLIVVAVVLLVGAAFFFASESRPQAPSVATPPPAPKQPPAVHAPKGELVSGFPSGLILGATSSVASSFSLNYDENLNQYTATFNSLQSMQNLYDAYLKYLQANNWTIINRITSNPGSLGIYATRGNADVSVTIIASGSKSQAQVSYLLK